MSLNHHDADEFQAEERVGRKQLEYEKNRKRKLPNGEETTSASEGFLRQQKNLKRIKNELKEQLKNENFQRFRDEWGMLLLEKCKQQLGASIREEYRLENEQLKQELEGKYGPRIAELEKKIKTLERISGAGTHRPVEPHDLEEKKKELEERYRKLHERQVAADRKKMFELYQSNILRAREKIETEHYAVDHDFVKE